MILPAIVVFQLVVKTTDNAMDLALFAFRGNVRKSSVQKIINVWTAPAFFGPALTNLVSTDRRVRKVVVATKEYVLHVTC